MTTGILTPLSISLTHLMQAAASATDARAVVLQLREDDPAWQALGAPAGVLEVVPHMEQSGGAIVPLEGGTLVEHFDPAAHVTDLVKLHLDLQRADGVPHARLVLLDVPQGWKSVRLRRTLGHLAQALDRQLAVLRDGPRLMAGSMLTLIDQVAELDEGLNVPTLSGLLRLVSGKTPTRSQVLALQIAGLIESDTHPLPALELHETPVLKQVLSQAGLAASLGAVVCPEPEPQPAPHLDESAPDAELHPHAKLRIMERDYLIAAHPVTDALHFRPAACNAWCRLDHGSADGWTKVAAEIIQADLDVTAEFVKTHLIRRRDLPTDEIAEAFELQGQIFWLRRAEGGLEIRLEGSEWHPIDVDPDLPIRDRAQAAARKLGAEHRIALDRAALDWAHRMAHAVQVTPHFGIAAE
jgi:hypothetical protein